MAFSERDFMWRRAPDVLLEDMPKVDTWRVFSSEKYWPFNYIWVQGQLADSYETEVFKFTFWSWRTPAYVADYIDLHMKSKIAGMQADIQKRVSKFLEKSVYLESKGGK